jgi:hypothetical protein
LFSVVACGTLMGRHAGSGWYVADHLDLRATVWNDVELSASHSAAAWGLVSLSAGGELRFNLNAVDRGGWSLSSPAKLEIDYLNTNLTMEWLGPKVDER